MCVVGVNTGVGVVGLVGISMDIGVGKVVVGKIWA